MRRGLPRWTMWMSRRWDHFGHPHRYPRAPNIAALERGLHVLVEKPVAASLAEADEMIAASKRTGKKILVGHHRRHHPLVNKRLKFYPRVDCRPLVASLCGA